MQFVHEGGDDDDKQLLQLVHEGHGEFRVRARVTTSSTCIKSEVSFRNVPDVYCFYMG